MASRARPKLRRGCHTHRARACSAGTARAEPQGGRGGLRGSPGHQEGASEKLSVWLHGGCAARRARRRRRAARCGAPHPDARAGAGVGPRRAPGGGAAAAIPGPVDRFPDLLRARLCLRRGARAGGRCMHAAGAGCAGGGVGAPPCRQRARRGRRACTVCRGRNREICVVIDFHFWEICREQMKRKGMEGNRHAG